MCKTFNLQRSFHCKCTTSMCFWIETWLVRLVYTLVAPTWHISDFTCPTKLKVCFKSLVLFDSCVCVTKLFIFLDTILWSVLKLCTHFAEALNNFGDNWISSLVLKVYRFKSTSCIGKHLSDAVLNYSKTYLEINRNLSVLASPSSNYFSYLYNILWFGTFLNWWTDLKLLFFFFPERKYSTAFFYIQFQ